MKKLKTLSLFLLLAPLGAHAEHDCNTQFRDLYGRFATPTQIEQQQKQLAEAFEEGMRDIQRGNDYYKFSTTPAKAKAWNEALLQQLRAAPATGVERGRLAGLPPGQMEALFEIAASHPVADYGKVKKWDPKGNFGFCFGRAQNIYHQALNFGVAKENVKKIWAVGQMKYDNIFWQHHVAGMVRGTDGKWYVLDPEYDRVLELRQWMNRVKKMDTKGSLLFLASDGKRFDPFTPEPIRPWATKPGALKDGETAFNGYFADYMAESRAEAAELMRQREAAKELDAIPAEKTK
ncbi:MAG: hypothetical protein EOP11_04185 [Proteobacteria bacterium]|nr:MAG: hypothetical protein EOP11_04185 [Pseudomonadota bacterium]